MIEHFAYADESYATEGAAHCVVAGYVASPRQWKRVKSDWQKVLDRYSVPEFHAKDFFARKNKQESEHSPYRNWSDKKANQFLDELIGILAPRRALYPIGGAVNVSTFNSFSPGQRRFLTNAFLRTSGKIIGTGAPNRPPYQMVFSTLLNHATDRVGKGVKVHFIFDRNDKEDGLAIQVFNGIKNRKSHPHWARLGNIIFADSQEDVALQCADLYAWLWNRRLTRGDRMAYIQKDALKRLTRKRTYVMTIWTDETISKVLSGLNPAQQRAMEEEAPL